MIEALAATTFLALALMAFAANTVGLTRNERSANNTSVAHALAQQRLEQLRSMQLGAAPLSPGLYNDGTLKADGTATGPFTRTYQVSANNSPTFGLRTVTVTVSWRDPRQHTSRLSAFVRCATIPC